MTRFVVPCPVLKTLPVAGGGEYPVGRIFCVGRNYFADDAPRGDPSSREAPFFFAKSWDTLLASGAPMPYPPATQNLHHEMEMVAAIGREAFALGPGEGAGCIWGYAAGIDMTRRDLQNDARAQGRPWEMGKIFEGAAPVGDLVPAAACPDLSRAALELTVNGAVRQRGSLADIIWNPGELVEHLSAMVRLQPGDLIFTGTPKGVGALQRGDVVVGRVAGLPAVTTRIV